MRGAVLFFLVLLAIPAASALNASQVQFLVDNQPLSYVSMNNPVSGTLIFNTSSTTSSVHVSSKSIIPSGTVTTFTNGCTQCEIPVTLQPGPTVTLSFQEYIQGKVITTSVPLIFKIDNTAPTISGISMDGCTSGCSYGPNQDTINFSVADAQSGVTQRDIVVLANAKPMPVECAQGLQHILCNATIQGPGDQQVTIKARDRAGNIGEGTIDLTYDDVKPQITQGPGFKDYAGTTISGGQQSMLQAVVDEPLSASVSFTSPHVNATGTCTRRNDNGKTDYVCTVPITPPNQAYTEQGNFTVTDGAGNKQVKTITLHVLQFNGKAQPDFWTVTAKPRQRLDPGTWSVLSKQFPVTLSFTPNTGAGNAQPLSVTVKDCSYVDKKGNPVKVSVTAGDVVPSRNAYLPLTLAPPNPASQLDDGSSGVYTGHITCTVDTTSMVGNTAFNPEEDTVTITPQFVTTPPPAQRIKDETTRVADSIQKNGKLWTSASRALTGLQAVCGTPQGLVSVAAIVNSIGSSGIAFDPSQQVPQNMNRLSSGLLGSASGLRKSLGKVCDALSCHTGALLPIKNPASGLVGDLAGSDSKTSSAIGNILQGVGKGFNVNSSDVWDPYKSLYAAAITACIPAIVDHEMASLTTQCDYQSCLQTMDQTGMTVQECANNQRYANCVQQRGDLYFAIPYTSLLDNIGAQIQLVAQDAVPALISTGIGQICKTSVFGTYVQQLGCKEVQLAQQLPNVLAYGHQVVAAGTTYSRLTASSGSDYCSNAQQTQQNLQQRAFFTVQSQGPCHGPYSEYTLPNGIVTLGINGQVYQETNGPTQQPNTNAKVAKDMAHVSGQYTILDSKVKGYQQAVDVAQKCEADYKKVVNENDQQYAAQTAPLKKAEKDLTTAESNYQQALKNVEDLGKSTQQYYNTLNTVAKDTMKAHPDNSITNEQAQAVIANSATLFQDAGCDTGTCDMNTLKAEISTKYHVTQGTYLNSALAEAIAKDGKASNLANVETFKSDLTKAKSDLDAAKKKRDEERDKAYTAAMSKYMNTLQGSVDMAIQSAVNGARLGYAVQSALGTRPPAPTGVAKSIANLRSDPITKTCSLDQSPTPTAYQNAVPGSPAARISATGDTATESGKTVYRYVIQAYLSVDNPPDENATVVLRGGTSTNVANASLQAGLNDVGQSAITVTSATRYDTACIVFKHPLSTYFKLTSDNGLKQKDALCTRVMEAHP